MEFVTTFCHFSPPFLLAQQSEVAHGMGGGDIVVASIATGGFWAMVVLVVAIPTIVHHRYKRRLAELNAEVKQQMIAKGYSPEEIIAVINEDASVWSRTAKATKMTPSKTPHEPAHV